MLMADTMTVFFVILGLLLAFPALWLLSRGLWPGTVKAARDLCDRGLLGSMMLGVPVAILIFLMTAMIGKLGTPGKIAAVGVVCFSVMVAACGVAGLATLIGERLGSPDDAGREWRATLRGGVVLVLTWLLPVLGWFVILPLSMIIGLGAALRAIGRNFRKRAPVAEAVSFGVPDNQGAGHGAGR